MTAENIADMILPADGVLTAISMMIYADSSVPDDWLFTMFLMRVRDRMIIFASQRLHDENEKRAADRVGKKAAEKESKQ